MDMLRAPRTANGIRSGESDGRTARVARSTRNNDSNRTAKRASSNTRRNNQNRSQDSLRRTNHALAQLGSYEIMVNYEGLDRANRPFTKRAFLSGALPEVVPSTPQQGASRPLENLRENTCGDRSSLTHRPSEALLIAATSDTFHRKTIELRRAKIRKLNWEAANLRAERAAARNIEAKLKQTREQAQKKKEEEERAIRQRLRTEKAAREKAKRESPQELARGARGLLDLRLRAAMDAAIHEENDLDNENDDCSEDTRRGRERNGTRRRSVFV
jgi:hypothetical protein